MFLHFTHKPNGTGHENHYDAIVDMESIPFHPITNEDKSKPSTPPTTALSESTPISAFNIKTEVSETTPTLGIVDMETIPFHSIVNQDKSKTPTQVTDPVTQQTVRHNLAVHRSVTPFVIWQPIRRPCLLERVYKPMHTLH